jgi:hypothetical protein
MRFPCAFRTLRAACFQTCTTVGTNPDAFVIEKNGTNVLFSVFCLLTGNVGQ